MSKVSVICPLCGNLSFDVTFSMPDRDGFPCEIALCGTCGTAIPMAWNSAGSPEEETSHQSSYHEKYWTESPRESVFDVVDDLRVMVGEMRSIFGEPEQDRLIVELGAGRGALLRALVDSGYNAIGCEPSPRLVEQATALLELNSSRLLAVDASRFLSDLRREERKVDVIVAWHVLEHLKNPSELLAMAYQALAPRGNLILQVPMLASEYLFREHLFFPTAASFHFVVTKMPGAEVTAVIDDSNLYLTVVIRKSNTFDTPAFSSQPVGYMFAESLTARDRKIQGLAQQLNQLKEEFAFLATRLDFETRHTPKIDEQISAEECEQMHVQIAGLREECDLLGSRIASCCQELMERDAEVSALTNTLGEQTRELDFVRGQLTDALRSVDRSNWKLQAVENVSEARRVAIEMQELHWQSIKSLHDESIARLQSEKEELAKEIQSISLEVERLTSELSSSWSVNAILSESIKSSLLDASVSQARIESLEEKSEAVSEQLAREITFREALLKQSRELEHRVEQVMSENQRLMYEVNRLTSDVRNYEMNRLVIMAKRLGILRVN